MWNWMILYGTRIEETGVIRSYIHLPGLKKKELFLDYQSWDGQLGGEPTIAVCLSISNQLRTAPNLSET